MFRALYAHHQEAELYWCSIWYRPLSQWSSGAQIERELQFSLKLCTGRSMTESDDTRCCINTIQPSDDEHIILGTFRGLNWTYCKMKQVCIKLVIVKVSHTCPPTLILPDLTNLIMVGARYNMLNSWRFSIQFFFPLSYKLCRKMCVSRVL